MEKQLTAIAAVAFLMIFAMLFMLLVEIQKNEPCAYEPVCQDELIENTEVIICD